MTKVRIRESVAIVEDSKNIYQFIFTASRKVKKIQV